MAKTQSPPRFAEPHEVEHLARGWSEDQLQCRIYGHVWRPLRATFHTEYRFYYTVQVCPRCESERHSELSERGHVASTWIKYAAGYLAEHVGRIAGDGKDVLRLSALQRVYRLEAVSDLATDAHSRATRGLRGAA